MPLLWLESCVCLCVCLWVAVGGCVCMAVFVWLCVRVCARALLPDVLRYASRYDDVRTVVAVSGRFNMAAFLTRYFKREQLDALAVDGTSIDCKFAGRTLAVTSADVRAIAGMDMSIVTAIPSTTLVTIVHGTADTVRWLCTVWLTWW